MGTGVGGIGQSFLVSNRFSEADPVLGQGVPCLTVALGMSSSGGGLEFGLGDVLHSGVCMLGRELPQIVQLPIYIPLLVWMLLWTLSLVFGWR